MRLVFLPTLILIACSTDADGDGLTGRQERALGLDPRSADSDGDGLDDGDEVDRGTDPLSADSDRDGLLDGAEVAAGTDPLVADSDGDGLLDGDEIDYGTDPLLADSDDDGLLDGDEVAAGTDPLRVDSDSDGLPDGDEIDLGTDPLLADSDNDGLLDGDEIDYGTDPLLADSDNDGLLDGDEFYYGTDPWLVDTDGDGLLDGEEISYGTNPLLEDTDGDGLLDGEEIGYGTSPLLEDTDGDGLDDGDELEQGFDPNDPLDRSYIGGWPYYPDKDLIPEFVGPNLVVGERFHRYKMVDQFGQVVDLFDFYNTDGKYVILDIVAMWAAPAHTMSDWLDGASDPFFDRYNPLRDAVAAGDLYWLTIVSEDVTGSPPDPADALDWYNDFPNPAVPVLADQQSSVPSYIQLPFWPQIVLLDPSLVVDTYALDTYTVTLDAAMDIYAP